MPLQFHPFPMGVRHGGALQQSRVLVGVARLLGVQVGAGPAGAVGAVVGATYPQELAELRDAMPHAPLLVPGYGTQGGGAADVAAAFTADGTGALISSSRAINFAYTREPYASQFAPADWEKAVEAATRQMIADLGEIPQVAQLSR